MMNNRVLGVLLLLASLVMLAMGSALALFAWVPTLVGCFVVEEKTLKVFSIIATALLVILAIFFTLGVFPHVVSTAWSS
jgi:Sec-independent protein secretion pathway component TatC